MRRQPSLRSQLNQIRMWVRQGRTDAWIAHKLDVSVDDLARFKRDHDLEADGDGGRARPADPLSVPPPEPRAEEPEEVEEPDELEEPEEEEPEREPRRRSRGRRRGRRGPRPSADEEAEEAEEPQEEDEDEEFVAAARGPGDGGEEETEDGAPRKRRRRGRRGGRRHRARRNAYEATFDHGGEGYGLWLDPAVAEDPVYSQHWAGHRAIKVTVEPEAITIRRADADPGEPAEDEDAGE